MQLVGQADAAPFLPHVDDHAAAVRDNPLHRRVQLLAAVAPQRMEDVARQALAMNTRQNIFLTRDFAIHQRQMFAAVMLRDEAIQFEFAIRRRKLHAFHTLHQTFRAAAVFDQRRHVAKLQPPLLAEDLQLRQPRHRAVFVQNLTDDAVGGKPRHAHQIHGRLRMAGPNQYAAVARDQRKNVARRMEGVRHATRIRQARQRLRAVVCGNARRRPFVRVDADGETCAKRIRVPRHFMQPELQRPLPRHRRTHEAARMRDHEIHRFGRDLLGRHDQVAFILAVLIIRQHNHFAGGQINR